MRKKRKIQKEEGACRNKHYYWTTTTSYGDNDLAITDTGVVLEEDANSNLNSVDVDDEYWKEVRNNPIIVTNSPNPKNNEFIITNIECI